MRNCLVGLISAAVLLPLLASTAVAQDAEDRDRWAVKEGDWTNDDNWVDNNDELSLAPTADSDRWAWVNSGTASVNSDVDTAGLTIGNGTVVIADGASLEVKTEEGFFSVGQTRIERKGTLRMLGSGSYKALGGTIFGTVEIGPAGSFALSEGLDFKGTLATTITGDGTGALTPAGDVTFDGNVSPTFAGVTPGFGDSYSFITGASSVTIGDKAAVVVPESVTLPRGLEMLVTADGGTASLVVDNTPVLQVDRVGGGSKIMNVVGDAITMTGYSVGSASGLLNPDGFGGIATDGWLKPNPLPTSLSQFNLTAETALDVNGEIDLGTAYNAGNTHPSAEDVTFLYSLPNGEVLEGQVEYVGPANDIVLNADPATGEVSIYNLSSHLGDVDITAYHLQSAAGSLKAADWTSMAAGGAEGWTEANPGANSISELNLNGSTVFSNGTVVSLGNIFDTSGAADLELQYTTIDGIFDATVAYGTVPDVGGGAGPGGAGPGAGPATGTPLAGDIDGDGSVGFPDFLVLSANFGMAGTAAEGDIDGDGQVGFPDFLALSANFGQSSGAAAAVPEPGSLALLAIGGGVLLGLRRQRRNATVCVALLALFAVAFCGTPAQAQPEQPDFPIDELTVLAGEVKNIEGPNDLVSLRNPANVIYAVNVWGDELERVVNGVTFTSDKEDVNPDGIPGYRTDWTHTVTNWQNKPEFGDSPDDDALEEIMTDIRWTNNSGGEPTGVGSHFEVTPGSDYVLELLISGGHNENRIWDIYIDDELVVSEMDSTNYEEYDVGVVYSYLHTYTATDDELNVTFNQERRAGIDGNAILQAAILAIAGPPIVPGDFNDDGNVDNADFDIMVANFHNSPASFAEGDINFTRKIDLVDFAEFRAAFEAAQPAAAVPEPGSFVLLGCGAAMLAALRCRRRHAARHMRQNESVGTKPWKPLLMAAVVLAASVGTSNVQAELLLYYGFEDGEGDTVQDQSGNDFHGIAADTFAFTADGFQGGAGDFGDFNNGAFVETPSEFAEGPNGFNKIVDSQEVTISYWLNREGDAPTNAWTFLFGGSRQLGSHAPWSDGTVYFDVAGCCGSNQRIATSMDGTDTDGEWHHMLYVKKANAAETDKAITAVFIDGVAVVSSPGCDTDCWEAGATDVDWGAATIDEVVEIDTASIGGDNSGGASHDGLIDEFAVWDEALSIDFIKALSEGGPVLPLREPLGDFNADNVVDAADFDIMAANFGGRFSRDDAVNMGDFNGDLRVNLKDFFEFRKLFNEAPAGAAVPEPGSLGLLVLAIAGLALGRRRQ